jgi:HEPN domain-containing protein
MKKEKKFREWIFLAEGDLKTAEDVNLQDNEIEARYPNEFYIPSIEEAKESVEIAKKVKSFVIEKLKKAGFYEG